MLNVLVGLIVSMIVLVIALVGLRSAAGRRLQSRSLIALVRPLNVLSRTVVAVLLGIGAGVTIAHVLNLMLGGGPGDAGLASIIFGCVGSVVGAVAGAGNEIAQAIKSKPVE